MDERVNHEPPLLQDPAGWPVELVFPAEFQFPQMRLVPVKMFTSQSDEIEGGFVLAIAGRALPSVFLGDIEFFGGEVQEGRLAISDARAMLSVLQTLTTSPRMDYDALQDLVLDGWRPE